MSTIVASPTPAPDNIKNLRPLHGRYMNSSSDVYKLPADTPEMDRLTLQHRICVMCQGGLYPPEAEELVQNLLAPTGDGPPPQIVDIGSGSGIWAVEMAQKFPHAKVLGIDLAESKPAQIPPNCSFIVRDVMNPLDEFENTFSLVHCRCVGGHVSSILRLVDTVGRILKPGGVFFFFDGNIGGYNYDRKKYLPMHISPPSPSSKTAVPPTPPTHSWFTRWMFEVSDRMACHGQDHVGGDHVEWHLRNCARFDKATVRTKTCWGPTGWGGEERNGEWAGKGEEIGRMMSINLANYVDAGVPLLRSTGVPQEDIKFWASNTRLELHDPSARQYFKWGLAWAQKAEPEPKTKGEQGDVIVAAEGVQADVETQVKAVEGEPEGEESIQSGVSSEPVLEEVETRKSEEIEEIEDESTKSQV